MTQRNNLSVHDVEATHCIPVFEEVYALDYVRESVEIIIAQTVMQYSAMRGYEDDIRQEMLIFLNEKLPLFTQGRSGLETYCRMVLNTAIKRFRRNFFSGANLSLLYAQRIDCAHEDDRGRGEVTMAIQISSENHFSKEIFRKDLHAAIDELSKEDKDICRMLLAGYGIREIAQIQQISTKTLYAKVFPRIKNELNINLFGK